jgi:aerobic-type carbon monoxide dehydrogenase small subunit (CoxS/CutS family)
MRKVTLNIDGVQHEVTVDVRETLWDTYVLRLGNSGGINLGCERAQCGACTVLVDDRDMYACGLLTARLGHGEKIRTVNGLTSGPGVQGLHPIQRAFIEKGGFQCGICTRGFIMSTYALLQTTKSPTDADIREGLAGNVCRCGEYEGVYDAVRLAAQLMKTG